MRNSLWLFVWVGLAQAQFFHPTLNDQAYLDKLEKELDAEVEEAESDFLDQAKVAENVTRIYITSKLKENAFRALRQMAEKELQNLVPIFSGQKLKVPKQGDDVELSGLENAVKVNGEVFELLKLVPLIPTHIASFLRDAFKVMFPSNGAAETMGTGSDMATGVKAKDKVKITPSKDVVDKAELLMDQPLDVQLLGVASLIAEDEQKKRQQQQQGILTKEINGKSSRREVNLQAADQIQKMTFIKEFRRSFKQLDEKSAAVYGGVEEAYTFLNSVRGVAAQLSAVVENAAKL